MDVSIEHRLTEVEQRAKSNEHRLTEVERRQDNLDELVSTVKVLAVREEQVETDVKEIKADVKSLTNKPAERWESVVDKVIMTIIGIIVGYAMTQIGF
jgi:hypothetical protein